MMATGLQPQSDAAVHVIRLLDAATATNNPPTSYTASGIDVGTILDGLYGAKAWPQGCDVAVYATAGSGVMTATIKLWCGCPSFGTAGRYVAASTGSATEAGVLNEGLPFDEHAADVIGRTGYIDTPRAYRKWYAEVTAIGGTSTAVTVDMIFPAVIP